MAPPSSLWVQRYLREHNIDQLLAEAVNQAVENRSNDPAASLALYFTKLSKRNGEITKLFARRILNLDLKPALELSVECFFNGESRLASKTVGQIVQVVEPAVPNMDEAAEDAAAAAGEEGEEEKPSEEAIIDSAAALLNQAVHDAVVGSLAKDMRGVDEKIKEIADAPHVLASLAAADAAAFMAQEPLFYFIAKLRQSLKEEASSNIGGGVAVEPGLGEDGEGVERQESKEGEEEEEGGEGSGEESGMKGLPMTMPVPLFPAYTAGSAVPDCKVQLRSFLLVGKRDAPLKEVLPQMLQVFSFLDKTASAKLGEEKAISKMPDGSIACAHDDIAQVMDVLGEAVEAAGLVMGEDVTVSLNFGATSFFISNTGEVGSYAYKPEAEGEPVEADNWADWVCELLDKYPQISSIEDVCAEEDYETWRRVRQAVEARSTPVLVLGNDLFKNDLDLIRTGVAEGWAGGASLQSEKLHTLSDILDASTLFTFLKPKASRVVLQHRPGHSAGVIEADLAVGIGAWGLVCAPPAPLSVSKYNRLVEIESALEDLQAQGLAHLRPWQSVYEEEEAAVAAYAEQVAEAEQGP